VLKSVIPIAFVLLALTAFSRLTRCLTLLFGKPAALNGAR
jgi:TRAP-type mannitol/chloroaromatic compound transport system permease small subunit